MTRSARVLTLRLIPPFMVTLACLLTAGCQQQQKDLLLVSFASDSDESEGVCSPDEFAKALKQGGYAKIRTEDILARYPDAEAKYAVLTKNGKYFVAGPLLNLIVDNGWNFHSWNFGGTAIFTR